MSEDSDVCLQKDAKQLGVQRQIDISMHREMCHIDTRIVSWGKVSISDDLLIGRNGKSFDFAKVAMQS